MSNRKTLALCPVQDCLLVFGRWCESRIPFVSCQKLVKLRRLLVVQLIDQQSLLILVLWCKRNRQSQLLVGIVGLRQLRAAIKYLRRRMAHRSIADRCRDLCESYSRSKQKKESGCEKGRAAAAVSEIVEVFPKRVHECSRQGNYRQGAGSVQALSCFIHIVSRSDHSLHA